MVDLDVEPFLNPAFGLRYIGYPALTLVVLSVGAAVLSVQMALGLLALAVGYVCVGVGFVVTLLTYHRFDHVR